MVVLNPFLLGILALLWHLQILINTLRYLPLPSGTSYLRTEPDHQANACELGSSPPLTSPSHEQHPIVRRRIRG